MKSLSKTTGFVAISMVLVTLRLCARRRSSASAGDASARARRVYPHTDAGLQLGRRLSRC